MENFFVPSLLVKNTNCTFIMLRHVMHWEIYYPWYQSTKVYVRTNSYYKASPGILLLFTERNSNNIFSSQLGQCHAWKTHLHSNQYKYKHISHPPKYPLQNKRTRVFAPTVDTLSLNRANLNRANLNRANLSRPIRWHWEVGFLQHNKYGI